jgi:hypothetical protein
MRPGRRPGFDDEQVTLSGARIAHVARLRPRATEVPPMQAAVAGEGDAGSVMAGPARGPRRPPRVGPRTNNGAQTPTGYRDNVY